MKKKYFLTLWNVTYLKDTSFGKKSCNFEHGLETKNEFEKWPLINFFSVLVVCIYHFSGLRLHLVYKISIVFTFSHLKAYVSKIDLAVK